jgi:TolB-like protein
MMQRATQILLLLAFLLAPGFALTAQEPEEAPATMAPEPAVIAIFPFKNLYGEVRFDDLSWDYADSLESWLNAQPGAGETFKLIPNIDVRDQLLAQNVDVKSPSYETDVWEIGEALGADKMIWGTYYTKYEKVYLKVQIIDLSINMADPEHEGESKGLKYEHALQSVTEVGEMLLPGLPF